MSIKIMTQIFKDENLEPIKKLVMLALADNSNDEGYCYPSVNTLIKKTSLTKPTIIKHIKELEELGLLLSERRVRKNGSNTSKIYVIYPNENLENLDEDLREKFNKNIKGVVKEIYQGGKGDLPGVVKEIYQGGKGDLPGVVKEIYQGGKGDLPLEPSVKPSIEPSVKENAPLKEKKDKNKEFILKTINFLKKEDPVISQYETQYIAILSGLIKMYSLEEVKGVLGYMYKDSFWKGILFKPMSIKKNYSNVRQKWLDKEKNTKNNEIKLV